MSDTEYARQHLATLNSRIAAAANKAGRETAEVRLIGAAKQQSVDKLQAFVDQGLSDLGHNYLQEAQSSKQALHDKRVTWHFIGHIQSNKTTQIAAEFDWIHSVDRFKIARRLAAANPNNNPLNILLQVNIDDEPSKAGVNPDQTPALVEQVLTLQGVRLRGFMTLPKPRSNPAQQRQPFARLRELKAFCETRFDVHLDTLSMGMSQDLEAAIIEGSTMIRVGTDLFGRRPQKPQP